MPAGAIAHAAETKSRGDRPGGELASPEQRSFKFPPALKTIYSNLIYCRKKNVTIEKVARQGKPKKREGCRASFHWKRTS